jgi:hypothetical protein
MSFFVPFGQGQMLLDFRSGFSVTAWRVNRQTQIGESGSLEPEKAKD